MKIKNLLATTLVGFSLLSLPKLNAQTYDSLKTVEVAKNLENHGFNLKGYLLNKPFQFQVDYGGNSRIINGPLVAEKDENDNLMIYPIFVAFNKNNSETRMDKDFIDNYGGLGFILDDNNVPPSVYADSIRKLLKGNITGVKIKVRNRLESKLEGIYPNPSNGSVNVKYFLKKFENVSFDVYDILGRKVYSFEGKEGERIKRINTGDLSSGIYFLRMNYKNERKLGEIRKFIILK